MKGVVGITVAVLLGGLLCGSLVWYGTPILRSATSLAARQACTLNYVSGLPDNMAKTLYIDRHIRPAGPLVTIKHDPSQNTSTATLAGLISRKALFREAYGCVLDHDQQIVPIAPWPQETPAATPISQSHRSERFDAAKLEQALATALSEPDANNSRQTVAVVVLSQGKLVAERYAPGVNQQTPLPGFSMAKSMVATLMGMLVHDQKLDVGDVIPGSDALTTSGVTYDQLLRMTSGLNLNEDGSGRDANSIMLTQQADAAAYARSRGLVAAPGERFDYSGGGPVILSKLFNTIAGGGDPSKAYGYLYQRLIEPLALHSLVIETDSTGTFLGSSFMSASALDWAKLGQLYLQNGLWQGQQILPENWAGYVSTYTEVSAYRDYGAGFWTTHQGGRDARHQELPLLPEGTFFMHGMMNQAVFILPEQQLVIVRLGATRDYLASGEWQLVEDVLSSMRTEPHSN